MLPTKQVFGQLQVGDYVKVKTLGQLIDSGWVEDYGVYLHEDSVAGVVPQMLERPGELRKIEKIVTHPVTNEVGLILEGDELPWKYTLAMLSALYPLQRGVEE